jgi:DnaJ-class molecular chaperone
MRDVYSGTIEDNEEVFKHHQQGKPDFYQVLGVGRSASPEELQKAHRNMTMQYHSGTQVDQAAAQKKMTEINLAAEVLRDQSMRAEYDQLLGMLEDAKSKRGKPAEPKGEQGQWFTFPGDDAYSQLINEAMERVRGKKVRMKFNPKEAGILGDRGFKELEQYSNFNRMYAKATRQRDGTVVVEFGPV